MNAWSTYGIIFVIGSGQGFTKQELMPQTTKQKTAKPLRRGQRTATAGQSGYRVTPQENGATVKEWGGRLAVALTMVAGGIMFAALGKSPVAAIRTI